MELSVAVAERRFSFSAGEITGAVGDSVTVLPVVVAVSALTELRLPVLLLWFAAFQVVWGVWYGRPISVEQNSVADSNPTVTLSERGSVAASAERRRRPIERRSGRVGARSAASAVERTRNEKPAPRHSPNGSSKSLRMKYRTQLP